MSAYPPPVQPTPKKTNVVLIIVIVVALAFCLVIPILAAILFPVFSQAKLAARKTSTLSDAKRISLALMMYAAENNDALPPRFTTTEDLRAAAEPYMNPGEITYTSANPDGGEFLPNKFCEGVSMYLAVTPSQAVLVYDSVPWKSDNGRVVSYFDGSGAYIKMFDEASALRFEIASDE